MAVPQPAQRPQVPFDGTTTNRDTFVPHAIQARMAPPPAAVAKEHIPFDGTTMNKVWLSALVGILLVTRYLELWMEAH
jgi:hypothetical protein